jgi:hypothetical protein
VEEVEEVEKVEEVEEIEEVEEVVESTLKNGKYKIFIKCNNPYSFLVLFDRA